MSLSFFCTTFELLLIPTKFLSFSLPLGLSTETNVYALQRASHAKKWNGLIDESGNLIFTGLAVVITLDDVNAEKKW